MDASSAVQTVAQAVQAATQQAQQAASHSSPSARPPSAPSSSIDNLTCQWQGCGERCDSAESLYDHVCERHVGRKSTNNLNLTCQWGACRTTTVKRDHITSHIRVHVPLKPHKCDFCGKAFKRPQDLKKHVKTHADDSVLMSSPQHGAGRGLGSSGLGPSNGKPSSYYGVGGHDASMGGPYPSYQPSMANGTNGASFSGVNTGAQYAGYGSVSYPTSSTLADIQSMDTRRRAIEALNDFLGDIKRRAIDPNSYYDVGHRLQSNALPLPVGTGYNTGYNNSTYNSNYSTATLLESFNNGNMGGHGTQAGVATHGYSLPLPNARTKTDLQDIDRFLEQLQTTVYEASRGYEGSNAAAAAGVQQTGIHTHFAGEFGMSHQNQYPRASHSPPHTFQSHLNNQGMGTTTASMNGVSSTASALDTPALTPASVSSYTSSGQSPMSNHGRDSYHGRDSFGSASSSMYPSVPSAPGMSDLGPSYPTTTSAPASGIASGLGGLDHRRGSGGFLQRQAPEVKNEDTEMVDADDGSRTPKAGDVKPQANGSLDPALREESERASPEAASTPANTSEVEDKRQEEWVENIRLIEALRKWIGERLKSGDYDNGEDASSKIPPAANGTEDLDVDMKAIETAKLAERLAAAIAGPSSESKESTEAAKSDVSYPTLPTAA